MIKILADATSIITKLRKKIILLSFAYCGVMMHSTTLAVESPIRWSEDLDVYLEQLEKKHINLFHTISKKEFLNSANEIRSQLATKNKSQIVVALMELTKKIGDGHTSIPLWGTKVHKFPIHFRSIDGKIFVEETSSDFEHLLGQELIAINTKPIEIIFKEMSKLVPFAENQYSTAIRVAHYLSVAEVLHGIGVIDDDLVADFKFREKGTYTAVTVEPQETPEFKHKLTLSNKAVQKVISNVSDSLWFSASADSQAIYIKFGKYTDMAIMERFAAEILEFINKNGSEGLIIDLRNNYGGDFFVGLKLAQYLVRADSLDWMQKIVVLINNDTFSAAMSNAAQFRQLLNATLVGEPTGATPSGYQDMDTFQLPNSRLTISYSKRLYKFTSTNGPAIYPDVTIGLAIKDYLNNDDRQLEWALKKVKWSKHKN